jgi:hypothetical protein
MTKIVGAVGPGEDDSDGGVDGHVAVEATQRFGDER